MQLRTGDLGYGTQDTVLSTSGIGSCVVVCIWDKERLLGAMGHIPYPKDESGGRDCFRNPGLSPDSAIPEMLRQLKRRGSQAVPLEAWVVGAGNMFQNLGQEGSMQSLVQSILNNTLMELAQHPIVIRAQAVGGRYGRSAQFEIARGLVTVTSVDGKVLVL